MKNTNEKINTYKLLDSIKNKIISGSIEDYNKYLDEIKDYAKEVKGKKGDNKKGITTSQIRIIFNEFKKINKLDEDEGKKSLQRLRVKLAYTGGRGSNDLKNFTTALEDIIKRIKDKKDIERLYEFIEAVVCYLKYHGDKD